LWPVIAVPLFVLSGRRSKTGIVVTFVLWLVLTGGVMIFWEIVEEEGQEVFIGAILLQTGAILMSLFIAALLRFTGYRLLRERPSRSAARTDLAVTKS
jgi:hypothetical protein